MNQPPQTTRRRATKIVLATLSVAVGLAGTAYAFGAPSATPRDNDPQAWTGRPDGIARGPAPALAVTVTSPRRTVLPGTTVTFAVRIDRGDPLVREARAGRPREQAPVWLSAPRPRPSRVVATFTPRATRSSSSTLAIRTSAMLRPGTYRIAVRARGRFHARPRFRMREATTTVTLHVTALPRRGFGLSGTLARHLAPGVAVPVAVRLTNPYRSAMRIRQLGVYIDAIHAPAADARHPCTRADFSVAPYSGTGGFVLPARSTRSLSALDVPNTVWPRIAMRNRPVNQDGCKHATLSLGFSAAAIGGSS